MDTSRLCINCMREGELTGGICPHCGFDRSSYIQPSYALEPLTILNGKYLLGRVLGNGGFGITYIAYDLDLEHVQAIKEFFVQGGMIRDGHETSHVTEIRGNQIQARINQINRQMFRQEAQLLAKLEHMPGIVRVYNFFEENNTVYLALEYLDGITLKEYVKKLGGRIDWKELFAKMQPILRSLEQLHLKKIYHRDISPDNIMLMKDGSLMLFDFGGAKVEKENADGSMMVLKKAGYTPIEQQNSGNVGPWTDEYALAATMYYCITGQKVPDAISRAEKDTIVPPRTIVPRFPKKKEKALLKALSVLKEDRYQNITEFEKALYAKDNRKKWLGVFGAAAASLLIFLRWGPQIHNSGPDPTPSPTPIIYVTFSPKKENAQPTPTSPPRHRGMVTPAALADLEAANENASSPQEEKDIWERVNAFPGLKESLEELGITSASEITQEARESAVMLFLRPGRTEIVPSSFKPSYEEVTAEPYTKEALEELFAIIDEFEFPITRINAFGVTFESIEPIGERENLTELTLSLAGITDKMAKELQGLTLLQTLLLSKNELSDIGFIEGMSKLKHISIQDNHVADLSPLSPHRVLQVLEAGGNEIENLEPLTKLRHISRLELQDNRIADLSPLSALTNLQYVDISDNYITDFSPLDFMSGGLVGNSFSDQKSK